MGCQHPWPQRPDIYVRQTIAQLIFNGKSTKCHDGEVQGAWELLIEDLGRLKNQEATGAGDQAYGSLMSNENRERDNPGSCWALK